MGCVVDNRAQDDTAETDSSMVDAALSVDASMIPDEPDMTLMLESCEQEDDLFGIEPAPISVGFSRTDLYLCEGAVDRFLLSAMGEAALIKLTADPASTDLDLAVLDLAGNILTESAGESGNENVIHRFEEGTEQVVIQVSGYRGVASGYALTVLSTCESDRDCPMNMVCNQEYNICEEEKEVECGLDEFEPNNREDTAVYLDDFPQEFQAKICGADQDWFAFDLERGDILDVLVGFPLGVDLDLKVLRASDGTEVTSALGDDRSNPERLQISHAEEGAYLLGITRYVRDDERDGDINYQVEIIGRSGGCASSEDCLTPELPICDEGICRAPIELADLGEACGRDEDCVESADFCYQGFDGGQDNLCTLRCQSDARCVAIGVGAYCTPINFREGACVPACTSNEQCGDFYVCNDGRCEVDNACRLDNDCGGGRVCRTTRNGDRFCAEPREEAACGEDIDLEPNNTFVNAVELPIGQRVQDLRICNDDDDYFVFNVPDTAEGDNPWRLRIETTFRDGVDIDLYVYDGLGNALGESITPADTTEAVDLEFLAPGPIFARIDQFDSDRLVDTTYSLLATLTSDDGRCTAMEQQCASLRPQRIVCDETLGACVPLEGEGMIALGERCDSNDDCVDGAQFCSVFDEQRPAICTRTCESARDCREIGETECIRFGRGFAVCL